MIWDARLKHFASLYQIFIFKSVATRIPDLTRLADPSWSPVYSDVFNQNIYFVLLNFCFQKCRDPNPRLDPVGGSKLEPGLLRRFQSKHLFCLIKFLFSKVSRPESPTLPERRIRTGARFTPTFSIIFPKHVVYVILFWTFLIKRKHFFSGNPMTIYKFETPITFTLNTCIYI